MTRTRLRRGKIVVIPEKWVGKVPHPQSIRKRPSKQIGKRKKETKLGHARVPRPAERRAEPE